MFDPIKCSEAVANVDSFRAVPASVLPAGDARDYLVCAAGEGRDVYAYKGHGPDGKYNVWLEGLRLCLQPLGDETVSEFDRYFARVVTQAKVTQGGAA